MKSRIVARTSKEQCEDDDELIDSVSQDVLSHGAGDQRLVATIWLPPKQRLCGRLGGQGQGCKRVHDQVHPQHLHGLQGGILRICKENHKVNQQRHRAEIQLG